MKKDDKYYLIYWGTVLIDAANTHDRNITPNILSQIATAKAGIEIVLDKLRKRHKRKKFQNNSK